MPTWIGLQIQDTAVVNKEAIITLVMKAHFRSVHVIDVIYALIVLLECFVKLFSQTFVMDFHKAYKVLLILYRKVELLSRHDN